MHLVVAPVRLLLAICLGCRLQVLPEIFDDGVCNIVRWLSGARSYFWFFGAGSHIFIAFQDHSAQGDEGPAV